jgi:hypothetical protein
VNSETRFIVAKLEVATMFRFILPGIVLLQGIFAPPLWAHWEVTNVPYPWATPGQVRWLINYSKMEVPHVKLMLEAQFNLVQGGSFTPEALQLARATPGVHTMQYICSRTIYHEKLFQSNPELKDAAIRNPDGSYKIIYNNPARYAGCYNRDAWLNYIKTRMDAINANGVDCIFFDNPMTWACYCPTCQELFRRYSKEKTGQELSLGQFGKATELENWFAVDTAQRWFEKVHAYARETGMFIVANNLTYWLVNKGVTDGVFSESGGHAPFAQDIAAYKIGLAASHGKPTGILDYVPGPVRQARGKQVFNGSRGSGQKWVGAPVAEEYEVAYAQGLACGGNYIANYSLELGRRIEHMTDPEDKRIQSALVKYGTFAKGHPEIYASAQPGSPVAILYSLTAGPREGQILGVHRGTTNKLLWTLINGGVPAEVTVEDDLTPERLAGFRGLILGNVSVLEPEAAEGIARFVQAGGTLVLAAPGNVRGRYESASKARPMSAYFPGLPEMDSFTYGPTDMELDGYEVSGPYLKLYAATGRAALNFKGREGQYPVTVSYLDENDGQGSFELGVDGKQVGQWQNNVDDDKVHSYVSPTVTLRPGAKVTVVGHQAGGEYGRLLSLRITTDAGPVGLMRCKVGKGEVLQLACSLTEARSNAREAVLSALRPLCPVSTGAQWPPKLLMNLTKASPQGPICVHLVNYDLKYDDKYALQSIEPAGPVSLRVFDAKTARLLSPDAAERSLEVTNGTVEVPPVKIYSAVILK